MDQLSMAIGMALRSRKFAYAPYSKYKVGCAVIAINPDTRKRAVYSGCNIENASYGLTICAERVAIFKAVSNGYTWIETMVICTEGNKGDVTSCGACRQVEYEFGGPRMDIMAIDETGEIKNRWLLKDLLPCAFGPASLGKGSVKWEKVANI